LVFLWFCPYPALLFSLRKRGRCLLSAWRVKGGWGRKEMEIY